LHNVLVEAICGYSFV